MKIGKGINAKRFIVDASVAVKWFFQEIYSDKALILLENLQKNKIKVFAPELLLYEVGNALGKGKRLDRERVLGALHVLFQSRIKFFPMEESLMEIAVRFMLEYDITFYDASYGALAFSLGIPLLTANPKDQKKIKEIEVIDF